MKRFYYLLFTIGACLLLHSCSISQKISKQAKTTLLKDSAINSGHIGICIYDPVANKYLYNYNADKYFIPASNTKLFTLYAGMKYLGDSLVGLRYYNFSNSFVIIPSGDPTFLHQDFSSNKVIEFIKEHTLSLSSIQNSPLQIKFSKYGKGWQWDDLEENYAVERSAFPMYGNKVDFFFNSLIENYNDVKLKTRCYPPYFSSKLMANLYNKPPIYKGYYLTRNNDRFQINGSNSYSPKQEIPFSTDNETAIALLRDTLKNIITITSDIPDRSIKITTIHSQPSDSLFKPMMHRSDNFFAEQTLLMASNEYLGYMSDEKMIDTILKTSLSDLTQKPKWVDGSGLSRYNLATPKSLVYLLNKMKNEFGLERLKEILPTGGEGTLSSYFKNSSGSIFAKTGTLSNNCALSGFLITKKGKLLVFSVMNNNYITGATPIRKAVEQFLLAIKDTY